MKLSQLAEALGLHHQGADVEITGIAPLESVGPQDITYVSERKYLHRCGVGAVILPADLADNLENPCLLSTAPAWDLARVAQLLGMRAMTFEGIHPTAVIHETAVLGANVVVGARAFIGAAAHIGAGTVLHPGVVVHERCVVGQGCTIQSNTVIGSEGFALEIVAGRPTNVPHFGIVRIEDGVDIGASCTIDRARFGETVIGAGSKIDNLVQIAHNVQIGRCCVIVAQVGIAGSVRIGDGAVLGGQVGVVPHVTIGKGARIASSTGIPGDVPDGAVWSGWWGKEHKLNLMELSSIGKLPEFMKTVKNFMKRHGE